MALDEFKVPYILDRSLRGSCWAGAGFLEEGPCGAGIQTSRRGCQLASSAGFSDVWLQGVVQLALHIRGCRTPGYTGPTELCHFIDGTWASLHFGIHEGSWNQSPAGMEGRLYRESQRNCKLDSSLARRRTCCCEETLLGWWEANSVQTERSKSPFPLPALQFPSKAPFCQSLTDMQGLQAHIHLSNLYWTPILRQTMF